MIDSQPKAKGVLVRSALMNINMLKHAVHYMGKLWLVQNTKKGPAGRFSGLLRYSYCIISP